MHPDPQKLIVATTGWGGPPNRMPLLSLLLEADDQMEFCEMRALEYGDDLYGHYKRI